MDMQENQGELKNDGLKKVLVCAVNINSLAETINTMHNRAEQ
jgi:hypothetical protein